SKVRALTWLPRHRPAAPHHARELARDGEAEPSSAILPCGRGIGLGEFLEQLGLLLGCHADAGVGYRDLDPVAPIDHLFDAQLDFALLCKLAGIAQQVEQDLP